MTYYEADRRLQGRCKNSRRLENNTYLERRGENAIAVRFHATDVLTFRKDGSWTASTGGWNTVTTRDRLSRYSPPGYSFGSDASQYGQGMVVYRHSPRMWTPLCILEGTVTFAADGSLKGGGDIEEAREDRRKERNQVARERYQERFWLLAARRVQRGGKVPRKPLTLEMIQAEANVSTRTAMIRIYGLERYLVAVKAESIDTVGEYSLLTYPLEDSPSWGRERVLRALKMTCPSTGTCYIHPVDPSCRSVSEALDWIFQTPGYLNRLQAEA